MTNVTGCDLHIPHKTWSTDTREAQNYFELERWSVRLLAGHIAGTVTEPLHFPFKDWTNDPQESQNYSEIERWSVNFQLNTSAQLHIPHKSWASDEERQNYTAIEEWARRYSNCFAGGRCNHLISSGGVPINANGDIGVPPDGTALYVVRDVFEVGPPFHIDIYSYPIIALGVTVDSPGPPTAIAGGTRFGGGGVFWLSNAGTGFDPNWPLYFGNAAVLVVTIVSSPFAKVSLASAPSGKLYSFDTGDTTLANGAQLLEINPDLSTITTVVTGINCNHRLQFQPTVATDGAVWVLLDGIATGTGFAQWIRYDPGTATSTSGFLPTDTPATANFLPDVAGNVVATSDTAGFQVAPDGTVTPFPCMDNQIGGYGAAGWSDDYSVLVWGGEHTGDYVARG